MGLGGCQPLALGVHRSDYMVDTGSSYSSSPRLLQIELNTVAASFASLSTRVAELHAHLRARFADDKGADMPGLAAYYGSASNSLPVNNARDGLAAALVAASEAYCKQREAQGTPSANAAATTKAAASATHRKVVAFVVQGKERNVMDQRQLEYAVWEQGRVPVVRVTMEQVAALARIDDATGALLLPCNLHAGSEKWDEVTVAYFRSGYGPEDYVDEAAWDGRKLIELSCAVKCPCAAYQLVGTKKVQQALAAPGALERFVTAEHAEALRSCFAGLWSLDPAETNDTTVSTLFVKESVFLASKPHRSQCASSAPASFLDRSLCRPLLSPTRVSILKATS
jgi:glutathione synthetase